MLYEGDLDFILVIKSYGLLQQKMMGKCRLSIFDFTSKNVPFLFFLYWKFDQPMNRSVTCPVIKSFDRTKGKI